MSVRLGNGAHACMQCEYCPPPGPPTTQCCGCWIYAVAIVGVGTVIIAVDYPEVQAIEHCHTPDEVFTLLRVWPD
jgi:hypothetical protein